MANRTNTMKMVIQLMTSNGVQWAPELVPAIREFLGEDGITFFREIRDEHNGELAVVLPGDFGNFIPHSVHFNEGMQVRNSIRTWYSDNNIEIPDCHSLDDCWEELTLEAIK